MRKNRRSAGTLRLGRFEQFQRRFYTVEQGLPDRRVTALAIAGDGTLWAGTDAGLACLSSAGDRFEPVGEENGPPAAMVRMLYADREGNLWANVEGTLYRRTLEGRWVHESAELSLLVMTEDHDGSLWAATDKDLLVRETRGRQERAWEFQEIIRGGGVPLSIAAYGGRVVLATSNGLYSLAGKRPRLYRIRADATRGLVSDHVRSVFADPWGHMWIGTDKGICIYDNTDCFFTLDGTEGLPYENVQVIYKGLDGQRWFGTSRGLVRMQNGRFKYFASRRWLPSDDVKSIVQEGDGTVWVGMDAGISRLTVTAMTLEEKAAHYERIVDRYHTRLGYVTTRDLTEEGNLESGSVHISDNDGLWTGVYVAAQSYRYAVTGSADARAKAQRSVHAMLDLHDVTGRPGFIARAVVHRTEPQFGVIGPRHEWHLSADGEWEWKGDTSSDELTGHMYAYSVFYDLAADEEDKKRLRTIVGSIMDHVLEHNYCLTDVDGLHTTWAIWSPERLNHDAKFWEQRGINSLQLLSFLKTAAHITGNEKYEAAYREMITRFHYGLNTLEQKIEWLGEVSSIDDNLGFHAYVPLLTYEQDPDLRAIYLASIEHHWQFERRERSPMWNAIYGALTGRACDMEAAAQSLAEMPLDLIRWPVMNSHRNDLRLNEGLLEYGIRLMASPLPFDERPLHKWDKNPYGIDGGDGNAEDGTVYLHPYWLARYWKLIEESSVTN